MAIEDGASIGAIASITGELPEIITTRKTAEITKAGDPLLIPSGAEGILLAPMEVVPLEAAEIKRDPVSIHHQSNGLISRLASIPANLEKRMDNLMDSAMDGMTERNIVGKGLIVAEFLMTCAAIRILEASAYDAVVYKTEHMLANGENAALGLAVAAAPYMVDRIVGKRGKTNAIPQGPTSQ